MLKNRMLYNGSVDTLGHVDCSWLLTILTPSYQSIGGAEDARLNATFRVKCFLWTLVKSRDLS